MSRSGGYIRGLRDFWGFGETEKQRIERKLKELEEDRGNRPLDEEASEEEPNEAPEQKNIPGVYQDLEQNLEEIKCSANFELFKHIKSQCENRGDFSTECVINLLVPSVDTISMTEEDKKKLWREAAKKVHPDKCHGTALEKALANNVFTLLNSGQKFFTKRPPSCPFFELSDVHIGSGVAGAVYVVCKPLEQKRDCRFVVKIQPVLSESWIRESSMLMYISDHPERFNHKQIIPKIYGVCVSTPVKVFGEKSWTRDFERKFQDKFNEHDQKFILIFNAIKELISDKSEKARKCGPMGFVIPK